MGLILEVVNLFEESAMIHKHSPNHPHLILKIPDTTTLEVVQLSLKLLHRLTDL